MQGDFGGQASACYHRYRRGYPSAVIDALAGAVKLTGRDVTVDLGCGTGQLTLPMARQVRAVIGVDVDPDMPQHARQAARDANARNVSWMLGADTDVPALRRLLGDGSVAAVTIARALHWMNHQDLFRAAIPLLRPGGGIAVVTNGTPLWLQETGWSRALRDFLEHWLGTTLTHHAAPTSSASNATGTIWPRRDSTCSAPPSAMSRASASTSWSAAFTRQWATGYRPPASGPPSPNRSARP